MGTESEERNLGRRGKKEDHADSTTDDACHKGDHHRHLVATECCFLILFDVLHSIETFGERCHECIIVVEMGLLSEEKFLKGFIFVHIFSLSFSLLRPRESCCLTASSEDSVMVAISLMLYPLR